jgi:hypothetical protein
MGRKISIGAELETVRADIVVVPAVIEIVCILTHSLKPETDQSRQIIEEGSLRKPAGGISDGMSDLVGNDYIPAERSVG